MQLWKKNKLNYELNLYKLDTYENSIRKFLYTSQFSVRFGTEEKQSPGESDEKHGLGVRCLYILQFYIMQHVHWIGSALVQV